MKSFLKTIGLPRRIRKPLERLLRLDRRPFPPSALANKFCVGEGLEIGGSAHNPFGLNTRNVDYTKEITVFKKMELDRLGRTLPVDIEAPGDAVPLPDGSVDFVISSHVLEHFFDPIKALQEWYRLIRPGGVIFMIVPHKERTFDKEKSRTPLSELLDRHAGRVPMYEPLDHHFSVWITEDMLELIIHMNRSGLFPAPVAIVAVLDRDDKIGNGFSVVLRK